MQCALASNTVIQQYDRVVLLYYCNDRWRAISFSYLGKLIKIF